MTDPISYEREREDQLHLGFVRSLPGPVQLMAAAGSFREVAVDLRGRLKIESQGGVGACQGHSLSSILEYCAMLATGDSTLEGVQLSRAFGYYETQRVDGLDHRGDVGSTISGGGKLAIRSGVPEEHCWAYPPKYNNTRPNDFEAVLENARTYKAATLTRIKTYDEARAFLGAAIGGINIGIRWSRDYGGLIEKKGRSGRGGHAVALMSLSERKDDDGKPYVWLMNSWGKSWGNRGWSEVSPRAVSDWMKDKYTTAIGISDLPNVLPRVFDFDDWRGRLTVI